MIQIIDNFLDKELWNELIEDYHQCRMYSAYEYGERLGSEYYRVQSWVGCYRSDNLTDIYSEVTEKIKGELGIEVQKMTFFEHPQKSFPEPMTYGMKIPQHIDANFERSGVLYMIGKEGMGTTIKDEYVEWQPNRAIAFDAQTYHNPNFGGKDRVSLTFFGKKT